MPSDLRAFVERFIQTLKQECLGTFMIVAKRDLNYINSDFQVHYCHCILDGDSGRGSLPAMFLGLASLRQLFVEVSSEILGASALEVVCSASGRMRVDKAYSPPSTPNAGAELGS